MEIQFGARCSGKPIQKLSVSNTLSKQSRNENIDMFGAALQFPFVFTLMQDDSVEVHNIETQTLVQSVPTTVARNDFPLLDRKALFLSGSGFSVPTTQRSTKLRLTPVKLLRPEHAADIHHQSTKQDLEVDEINDT